MHPTTITRVAERQWHAVHDAHVVGRGDTARRPDGRTFLSIDTWHDAVFDRLAETMRVDLPRPLYTLADEADPDLTSRWRRAGFVPLRREHAYVLPTDPRVTGRIRQPRVGLLAVRAGERRRGIGRALLAQVLGALHGSGVETACAEVQESNEAAVALVTGIGARRAGGNLELVLR